MNMLKFAWNWPRSHSAPTCNSKKCDAHTRKVFKGITAIGFNYKGKYNNQMESARNLYIYEVANSYELIRLLDNTKDPPLTPPLILVSLGQKQIAQKCLNIIV